MMASHLEISDYHKIVKYHKNKIAHRVNGPAIRRQKIDARGVIYISVEWIINGLHRSDPYFPGVSVTVIEGKILTCYEDYYREGKYYNNNNRPYAIRFVDESVIEYYHCGLTSIYNQKTSKVEWVASGDKVKHHRLDNSTWTTDHWFRN